MNRNKLVWLASLCAACGLSDARSTSGNAEGNPSVQRGVAAPHAVDLEYDAVGNLTRVTRGSAVTVLRHDSLDRATQAIDALGGQTQLGWSAADAIASLVDPRGAATTYERTGLGELTRLSSADTGLSTRTHDEAGNLLTVTDARGATGRFSYDLLNRLSHASYEMADAGVEFTWTYDDADGGGSGLVATSTFPAGGAHLERDVEGRVLAARQQVVGVNTITRYAYDSAGRGVSLTYASGRRLDVTWQAEVPTSLAVTSAGITSVVLDGLQLDGQGQPERWSWPLEAGARVHRIERDASGRVWRYPLGTSTRALSYDGANRIVAYHHLDTAGVPAPALDEAFVYDALDRLVGVSRRGESRAIDHDATGNRTASGQTAWTTAASSNRMLTEATDAGTLRVFDHDAVGNRLGDGTISAVHDPQGRLVSLTRGGITTRYFYDDLGRRVRKLNPSTDVTFVYDVEDRLLGEYDASGAALREYVWLGGTLVAFFSGAELLRVQTDHLGAVRVAFDAQGRERWRWLAEPFGDEAPQTDPSAAGPVELPLRFPGQYSDAESGLFYNRFRDYEPSTGRYLQSDPIGLAGGLDTYSYAANNPVSLVDPDGLTPTDRWFGHNDPGFQRWWHNNKGPGWFTSDDPGFDRKKPYDIPNRQAADAMRERYEELKRNGQLDNEERDECRRKRVDRAPRTPRGGQRGGGNGLL